jgi:hypothetical protein
VKVKPTYKSPLRHTERILRWSLITKAVPLTIVAPTAKYEAFILLTDGIKSEKVLRANPKTATVI